MDYSFAHALNYNMEGITKVINFYDINCSYMKKLRKRLSDNQFIGIRPGLCLTPGIGIWHVHGHISECYPRYAPLFIPAAGWVDGEVIETLWSILNVVSVSARGMSAPHRQEMLDFQMNDSNFMKMIRMCKQIPLIKKDILIYLVTARTLKRKLANARIASARASVAWRELDATVSADQREEWSRQERLAQEKRTTDVSAMDIYELSLPKGVWPENRLTEADYLA